MYRPLVCAVAVLLAGIVSAAEPSRPDILLADFEGTNWPTGWTVTGDAAAGPVKVDAKNPLASFLRAGEGIAMFKGTLTTAPFKLERRYLLLHQAGGISDPGYSDFLLSVKGKVVALQSAHNAEVPSLMIFDVGAWQNEEAQLCIKNGLANFAVDDILLSDHAPETKTSFTVEHKFVHIPINNNAPLSRLTLRVNGKVERDFYVRLPMRSVYKPPVPVRVAPTNTDSVFSMPLEQWKGKSVEFSVNWIESGSLADYLSDRSDTEWIGDDPYHLKSNGPLFHFTPLTGRMGDVNGTLYYKGEYHLFYQSMVWVGSGPGQFWGHAVSKDLVHWERRPRALYPTFSQTPKGAVCNQIFSGSGVVDVKNTAGFKKPGDPDDPIVLIPTHTEIGQCLFYSVDGGKSFKAWEGNPTRDDQGRTYGDRDPRVFWWKGSEKQPACWMQVVFGGGLYRSDDLKKWTLVQRISAGPECPDMFELPVDGDNANRKWVLMAAGSQYKVGDFDGVTFVPGPTVIKESFGGGYAPQTWLDDPKGRVVQANAFFGRYNGRTYSGAMSFPCELSLKTFAKGIRLCYEPIAELQSLYTKQHEFKNIPLKSGVPSSGPDGVVSPAYDVTLEIAVGTATNISLNFSDHPQPTIVYDVKAQELSTFERKQRETDLAVENGRIKFRLLVDTHSYELFADRGRVYLGGHFNGKRLQMLPRITASGGDAEVVSMVVHEIKPIWPTEPR